MKKLFVPNFFDPISKKLHDQIISVSSFLEERYGAHCFLVGGAVRDRLLGRAVSDVDMECYGVSPEKFEEAMNLLGADGVGRSFFVYKIGDLDISLPRRESKVLQGHRGFAVKPESSEKEASRRRDFTVNALMYDLKRDFVVDYWGGLEDLRNGVLRMVDERTFAEDSLRVLRAMQFSARLAFRIDCATSSLCRQIPLDDLPGPRIFNEFEKLFLSDNLHYGLYAMFVLGIAKKLFDLEPDRGKFLTAARMLYRYRFKCGSGMERFFFVAVLFQYFDLNIDNFLDAVDAPNIYFRKLSGMKRIPEDPMPSFVASLALKEGVSSSVEGCWPKVRRLATSLGIWEKPFDIGVTPRELILRGFSGRALGDEIRRITEERIKALETKR